MHPVYEYIVAVFILFLSLSYTFYAINAAVTTQLSLTKERQLKPIAERLFDKILFTPGYPVNWGSNIFINESNLGDFGLSSQKKMYELDVNKVMRLVNESQDIINPLYIPPETFGRLTGIYQDGHWIYGFRLLIRNTLNITISPLNPEATIPNRFLIHVSDYKGNKASNAYVRGVLYAAYTVNQGNEKVFTYEYARTRNITNINGVTTLSFNISVPPGAKAAILLIVSANYYGLQNQEVWVEGNVVDIVNIGQYLVVNMTSGGIIPSARHVRATAIEITSNLNIISNPLVNVTNSGAGRIINKGRYNYRVYRLVNPITENVIFVGLLIFTRGRYYLAFAARPRVPISVDYRSHTFPLAGMKTETVYGLFHIGDNSFYAQLTVWRMSE